MKNYYVVSNKNEYKIFKNEADARVIKPSLPNSVLKGFYSKKKAENWAKQRLNKKKSIFFVVVNGKEPGIYNSAEEMQKQVVGFENAIVKRADSIESANKILAQREKLIAQHLDPNHKKKETPEERLEKRINYLKSLNLKFKGDVICFIDCEANNEKVISLGATILNKSTMEHVATFYSTVKPKGFTKLDSYIEGLTKLTTDQILDSPDFSTVIENFETFLMQHQVTDIFSWSKSDKMFLKNSGKEGRSTVEKIVDIQPYISAITVDSICRKNWGLKDMLCMYGIVKEIEHNALSDANDLCTVFEKWFTTQPINLSAVSQNKSQA